MKTNPFALRQPLTGCLVFASRIINIYKIHVGKAQYNIQILKENYSNFTYNIMSNNIVNSKRRVS